MAAPYAPYAGAAYALPERFRDGRSSLGRPGHSSSSSLRRGYQTTSSSRGPERASQNGVHRSNPRPATAPRRPGSAPAARSPATQGHAAGSRDGRSEAQRDRKAPVWTQQLSLRRGPEDLVAVLIARQQAEEEELRQRRQQAFEEQEAKYLKLLRGSAKRRAHSCSEHGSAEAAAPSGYTSRKCQGCALLKEMAKPLPKRAAPRPASARPTAPRSRSRTPATSSQASKKQAEQHLAKKSDAKPASDLLGSASTCAPGGTGSSCSDAEKTLRPPAMSRQQHAEWAFSAFRKLDDNKSGYVVRNELETERFADVMRECIGMHIPDMEHLKPLADYVMKHADKSQDLRISQREFFNFTWRLRHIGADASLTTDLLFALFDADGSGYLDSSEFDEVFNFESRGGKGASSPEHIKSVLREVDADGDGQVSKAEYRRWSAQAMYDAEETSPPGEHLPGKPPDPSPPPGKHTVRLMGRSDSNVTFDVVSPPQQAATPRPASPTAVAAAGTAPASPPKSTQPPPPPPAVPAAEASLRAPAANTATAAAAAPPALPAPLAAPTPPAPPPPAPPAPLPAHTHCASAGPESKIAGAKAVVTVAPAKAVAVAAVASAPAAAKAVAPVTAAKAVAVAAVAAGSAAAKAVAPVAPAKAVAVAAVAAAPVAAKAVASVKAVAPAKAAAAPVAVKAVAAKATAAVVKPAVAVGSVAAAAAPSGASPATIAQAPGQAASVPTEPAADQLYDDVAAAIRPNSGAHSSPSPRGAIGIVASDRRDASRSPRSGGHASSRSQGRDVSKGSERTDRSHRSSRKESNRHSRRESSGSATPRSPQSSRSDRSYLSRSCRSQSGHSRSGRSGSEGRQSIRSNPSM
eukprot:TRINITY_DN26818_c0_g1_i1.p1 TRINITY_DN26818_c0_g1~~TRINITY_DN26818_c0_g1_i1.p1  ORF type:complete len:860 (-),score=170.50 TRINITY_DN26818_c0_g1_i1:232-2811(-)